MDSFCHGQRKKGGILRFKVGENSYGDADTQVQRPIQPASATASLILVLVISFISSFQVQAGPDQATGPSALGTPSISPTSNSAPKAAKKKKPLKTFEWYFKNGCNCAQCQAARQKQQENEERLKENFTP